MFQTFHNWKKYRKILKDKDIFNEYILNCGLDPTLAGKKFAEGLQHYVFDYADNYVLKIPKFDFFNSIYGILKPSDVLTDWKLIKQFFEEYILETEVFASKDNQFYAVIQTKVNNYSNLKSSNYHQVKDDFTKIHKLNKILEQETGFSLDLWGKSGVIRSVKHTLKKIKFFVEMTNIVIDKSDPNNPKLKIVDTNLYRVKREKMGLSRVLTDRIIFYISDFFLKRAKLLS